jgi:2-polyprenyl-6-methoxyphenol hydroxylase-like FAD-dependent oxidoreductase
MSKALIVGGGISGLATAMVLSRRGIEVDLVERAPRIEALGSGITLIGPALRALDGLGIYEDCVAEGFGVTDFEIYAADGSLADRFQLPSPVGTDQPGLLGMMRPALHRILLHRATEEGAVLRTGTSPVHIGLMSSEVEVAFDTGETGCYDLVIGADGLRSTVRDLVFGPTPPDFQGQGIFRVVLPRPAGMTAEAQFQPVGDVTVGFTPIADDRMYMYCVFPVEANYRPRDAELVDLVRARIEPFDGIVAKIRDEIREPGQVNFTTFETILAPGPWYRGRTLILGDAAHCTTPHLAAGAAMCLEDALVLGEELDAARNIDEALRAFRTRRYARCKYVVETAVQLSYWQTHPGTPGADHERIMAEAFERLADPF